MEFKEFSEFPDLDEEDFDIKSAFKGSSNNDPEESVLEEDTLGSEWYDVPEENEEGILEEDTFGSKFEESPEEDAILEEDIFEDYNIEDTLRRHNYNYGELIKNLLYGIDYDELMEILSECNINQDDLNHPSAEVFETLRNRIINGSHKQR